MAIRSHHLERGAGYTRAVLLQESNLMCDPQEKPRPSLDKVELWVIATILLLLVALVTQAFK